MLLAMFSLAIITIVHGECTDRTCVYGQCINETCNCNPGLEGKSCNMDIIDCDLGSCLNNGTCIELMNGFACQCLPNFDGPRCQYRPTKNDNHCKTTCLNNGKCIVVNNTEKCSCSSRYYGAKCEHIRTDDHLPMMRKCSLLKYRKNHDEITCVAIDLAPLFDIHCLCNHEKENKHFLNCQITPSTYSTQKCSFRTTISSATLTTLLNEPIMIHVCPVNRQILDQYESSQETMNNARIAGCQLL